MAHILFPHCLLLHFVTNQWQISINSLLSNNVHTLFTFPYFYLISFFYFTFPSRISHSHPHLGYHCISLGFFTLDVSHSYFVLDDLGVCELWINFCMKSLSIWIWMSFISCLGKKSHGFLGGKIHRREELFSSYQEYVLLTWLITVDLDHHTKEVFLDFATDKLFLFSVLFSSEESDCLQPTLTWSGAVLLEWKLPM